MTSNTILRKIRKELAELFGSFIYDEESYGQYYDYLNANYPGPEWLVWTTEENYLQFDYEFRDPKDEHWFLLKHS